MKRWLCVGVLAGFLSAGCVTTDTRDRPFTKDWANQVQRGLTVDRRIQEEPQPQQEERIGPAVIRRDESGRPKIGLGGVKGLGADLGYKSGPYGRIRFKHEWDFARPETR